MACAGQQEVQNSGGQTCFEFRRRISANVKVTCLRSATRFRQHTKTLNRQRLWVTLTTLTASLGTEDRNRSRVGD